MLPSKESISDNNNFTSNLKIRDKLRISHDQLLKNQKCEAIAEEDSCMKERVKVLRPIWRIDEVELATDLLLMFEKKLSWLYNQNRNFKGIHSDIKVSYETEKDTNGLNSTSKLILEKATLYTYAQSVGYLNNKRGIACDELKNALDEIINDVEIEGHQRWAGAVNHVIKNWEDGGEYYNAFVDSENDVSSKEELMVMQCVSEERTMAASMVVKELKAKIKKLLSSQSKSTVQDCSDITAQAASYISEIDRITDEFERQDNREVLEIILPLVSQGKDLQDRLDVITEQLQTTKLENVKLVAQVAIMRQLCQQAPGDGSEVLNKHLGQLL